MTCILTALTFSNARLFATNQQESIPWSEVGITATATYEGEGLSISRTEQGAHLRCNAQKLAADATSKGLWLSSMAATGEQFRVVATALSRSSTEARPIRISRDGKIAVTDRFVQFLREGVTEEYSVSVDGIRQDFVILERPQELVN